MTFAHEVSPDIRFVSDGRIYEPRGRRGEFVVVFGDLQSGPRHRTSLSVPFHARLRRPDGEELIASAQLDYPSDPYLIHEVDIVVLLHALDADDVPRGTVIDSLRPVTLG